MWAMRASVLLPGQAAVARSWRARRRCSRARAAARRPPASVRLRYANHDGVGELLQDHHGLVGFGAAPGVQGGAGAAAGVLEGAAGGTQGGHGGGVGAGAGGPVAAEAELVRPWAQAQEVQVRAAAEGPGGLDQAGDVGP